MDPADVVLRFLEGIGRKSEAEFYLGLFRAGAKERFATISVDASVARHAFDAVVVDLRFLVALGLTPVVTLGLFEPEGALEHAARLRRRLGKAGVPAEVVDAGATPATVAEKTHAGVIPILPYGVAQGAGVDDRFTRLAAMLQALAVRKLIFVSRRGGLMQKGVPVGIVNLTTDYEALAASKELSRKQHAMLAQARRLVDLVPHRITLSITSPFELLRELFTVRGAGTLLRRGAVIVKKAGLAEVDVGRMRALIAASFGRPPNEAFLGRAVSRIYLEEAYQGAAILIDTPLGGYLTKFAVDREAQGEGMGRDLWELMAADYPTVFWRARPDNAINAWYARQADGLHRFPDWHVFWKGLAAPHIPQAIEFALAQPVDLAEGQD